MTYMFLGEPNDSNINEDVRVPINADTPYPKKTFP